MKSASVVDKSGTESGCKSADFNAGMCCDAQPQNRVPFIRSVMNDV